MSSRRVSFHVKAEIKHRLKPAFHMPAHALESHDTRSSSLVTALCLLKLW